MEDFTRTRQLQSRRSSASSIRYSWKSLFIRIISRVFENTEKQRTLESPGRTDTYQGTSGLRPREQSDRLSANRHYKHRRSYHRPQSRRYGRSIWGRDGFSQRVRTHPERSNRTARRRAPQLPHSRVILRLLPSLEETIGKRPVKGREWSDEGSDPTWDWSGSGREGLAGAPG